MTDWSLPAPRREALAVWHRNILVWGEMAVGSALTQFGEPFIYLLGLGYELGMFIGQMAEIPYLAFLASGFVAFSATNTATFEGMWSVYTRMVPQQTYEAILATPTRVDDIVLGELLWCSTKGLFSGTAILIVAALLGAVESWTAVFALPILFLTGFFCGTRADHDRGSPRVRILYLLLHAGNHTDVYSLRCLLPDHCTTRDDARRDWLSAADPCHRDHPAARHRPTHQRFLATFFVSVRVWRRRHGKATVDYSAAAGGFCRVRTRCPTYHMPPRPTSTIDPGPYPGSAG